jgi:hypothetical protein
MSAVDQGLAREVLRYFLRNPEAADDLEGVARWRLLEEAIHRSVEETKQALAWLVSQGFLMERMTSGSGSIFCLNPKKRGEIDNFLGRPDSPRVRRRPAGR